MESIVMPAGSETELAHSQVIDVFSQYRRDLRRIKKLLTKSAEFAVTGKWQKAQDLLLQAREIAKNK